MWYLILILLFIIFIYVCYKFDKFIKKLIDKHKENYYN